MEEFLTSQEIMALCKCSRSTANALKKAVNDETQKRGILVMSNRTCLKRIFYELYVIGKK